MFWVTFFCALPKTLYFSGREPIIGTTLTDCPNPTITTNSSPNVKRSVELCSLLPKRRKKARRARTTTTTMPTKRTKARTFLPIFTIFSSKPRQQRAGQPPIPTSNRQPLLRRALPLLFAGRRQPIARRHFQS